MTNTHEASNATVRNFIEAAIKHDAIQDDDNMFELGLVNSLFAMQLVSFIEKEFSIKIEDEELDIDNFKSIAAISHFISQKTAVVSA